MAVSLFNENIAVHVNRRTAGLLFAGDFVLCQGESGSGASLGACNQIGGSMWRCRDSDN